MLAEEKTHVTRAFTNISLCLTGVLIEGELDDWSRDELARVNRVVQEISAVLDEASA